MDWKIAIYRKLVNSKPGIKKKYQEYRRKSRGIKRISAWGYLLFLNFQFFIGGNHLDTSVSLRNDEKKRIALLPESKKALMEKPDELKKKLEKYDVISFDVFDTLILRKFVCPEDVFYLVQEKLEYPDFKRLREEAEDIARKRRLTQNGDSEVSLAEIWEILEEWTGINKKVGMNAEWEAESESCYANPYFMELINLLKNSGKNLIICSDMYFNGEKVRELLLKCGYPEFEEYFVSSDYRCSKEDGQLYIRIKRKLGLDKVYIHIGDNEHSDVAEARRNGMDAIHYHNVHKVGGEFRACDMSPLIHSVYAAIVNGNICNGIKERSLLYEFGYIYGGILVTGYCQFIHEYVRKNQIDKILFLSRDGDILFKAYELMYEDESYKCNYVYWSRLAGIKMCARYFKTHYIERMIEHKINHNYCLRDIMETMQLMDMLDDFIEWTENGYTAFSIFEESLAERLKEYVNLKWDEVCGHYDEEIEEGKNYYKNILQDSKKVVVVDVGWIGSGPITLSYLIKNVWHINCTVTGMLAGTGHNYEGTELNCAKGDIVSYLFSSKHNRDLWKKHDDSLGHNLLVELLLSSDQPSFRGFIKDESGHYLFNKKKEKIDSIDIQQGILDFVRDYMEHPFSDLEISGRDAAAPLTILYNNQRWIKNLINTSEIKANIE